MAVKFNSVYRAAVVESVKKYLAVAEEKFNKKFDMPAIYFTTRKTTLGSYNSKEYALYFSELFFPKNYEYMINNTVGHEVAHLVEHIVYGYTIKNGRWVHHGTTWKMIMRSFGLPPTTRAKGIDTSDIISKQTIKLSNIKELKINGNVIKNPYFK